MLPDLLRGGDQVGVEGICGHGRGRGLTMRWTPAVVTEDRVPMQRTVVAEDGAHLLGGYSDGAGGGTRATRASRARAREIELCSAEGGRR